MLEVMYLDHSTSAGCGVISTDMHFDILPFVFLILRKHEEKNPSTSYCICCMNIAECSLSVFCVLDLLMVSGNTMRIRTEALG